MSDDDFFDVVAPPARVPGVLDRSRSTTTRSRGSSPRRPSRRARRTSSRGSSSSYATTRPVPQSATSRGGRGKRGAAPSPRRGSHRRCSPRSITAQPAGSPNAPVNIVVCADVQRGLGGDDSVVDLPRGAEPVAGGDRARPRQRAHDDHHRLSRRDAGDPRAPRPRVADRARPRSAIRPDRSVRPAAPRSPSARTGSATASRW